MEHVQPFSFGSVTIFIHMPDLCDELMVCFALLLLQYSECRKGENVNAGIDLRNTGFRKVKQLKQRRKYLGIAKMAHLPFQVLVVLESVKWIFSWKRKDQNVFNKYSFTADDVPGTALSNLYILTYLKIKETNENHKNTLNKH